jgi:glycolate oxidase
MSAHELLNALSRLYPADRLLTDDVHLASYESDGLTAFAVRPRAVVVPETGQDVIETVRICSRANVPFVARGSGTSLSGGSLPVEDGIVIALNRLNRILDLDPVRRIAIVEPGVVNLTVSEKAAAHDLYFAPDPSSQQVCTIGGNVAFNAGGAHCLKYGMTTNHVLGLKLVLATGEVVEFGGDSLEMIGPDWTSLFAGSEGLFGVALEITLRLLPKVESYHTVLAGYDSLEKAGDAVSMIVSSGLLPGALEIMDKLAIEAAEYAVNAGYPKDVDAVLIVELEGPAEELDAEKPLLAELLRSSGPTETHVAADAIERARIWRGRKSAFSAVGRLSPDFIVQDGVVPRNRLGEALRKIKDVGEKYDVRIANVFHAGDGNLHPLIMYDGRVDGALERAESAASEILKTCVKMGGSITGEHGVGMEKRQYLSTMFSEDDIDLMKSVRRAFDPAEISNPGKMFPDGEAPSLSLYGLHPLEKAGLISRE